MEKLDDYRLLEKVFESRNSLVYRAKKEGDRNTVIIKYLRARFPGRAETSRFKQEYEIIRNLNLDGIIQTFALLDYEGGVALILEDFEAVSLREFLKNSGVDLTVFLDLTIRIAEVLGLLHKKNVVHGDIKPDNILIEPNHLQVKISDFGIAHIITHEHEDTYHPEVIEGTLKYMSPEQTGRMNRVIDYRTDLYSLGITFYEMLTGRSPFISSDPLELIHSHIAREPVPPDEINPEIPAVLSRIVLKLMAKSAEERYQNAFGLLHDLRKCLDCLETKGEIDDFELATNDISLNFNIPQKLVGREEEQKQLLEAFERVVENKVPETVLVSGYPGTGKSFLVNEIYKSITIQKGYFISGKYEQFRGDVPYSSIIQAFIRLIDQILVESTERIELWRQKLQKALGDSGKLITDVIPILKTIIGEQPEITELGPEEAENVFHYEFKNLIRVLAAPEHPLVLFLDDLQWMDWASLQLIHNIITDPEIGCFFFIGAYRDNEIDDAHMLAPLIKDLRESRLKGTLIYVNPLDQQNVKKILGNFLRLDPAAASSLAGIIYAKTSGNPFFINQFVKRLYEKNLIEMDSSGNWQWDEESIGNMQVTDNVVDLMVEKIEELPENDRDILTTAACIGNRFDLETMSVVRDSPPEKILSDMTASLNTGLLYFMNNMCYFLHDRIQEAAYSLISEDRKANLHYAIGMHILRHTPENQLKDKIFYIVNQLNAGRGRIAERRERIELVRLNLLAGTKARDSAAYDSALAYLAAGLKLLEDKDWKQNYRLCFDLYFQAAEAAYLNADFPAMETYTGQIFHHSDIFLDRVKAWEIRIQAYMAQNNLVAAAGKTLEIFSALGVNIPPKISNQKIAMEFYKTRFALRNKSDAEIINLPEMNDKNYLAAVRIATSAAAAFYAGGYSRELLFIVLKMLQIFIRRGLTPQAPYWFACYFMVLHTTNQLEMAFRFSDIALSLKNKLSPREIRVRYLVLIYMDPWRKPLNSLPESLYALYQSGFEVGDVEYSLLTAAYYCLFQFSRGQQLEEFELEIRPIRKTMQNYQMETVSNYAVIMHQMAKVLMGESECLNVLSGGECDEQILKTRFEEANDRLGVFFLFLFSSMLSYFSGHIQDAFKKMNEAKRYLDAATGGSYFLCLFYFYRSLILLSGPGHQSASGLKQAVKKVSHAQRKLKHWSKYAPENFKNKSDLVDAELLRVKGDFLKAETAYESAISGARENGFIHEEALACELLAFFYHERGLLEFARTYMGKALTCYSRWGARGKVEDMKNRHPELLSSQPHDSFEPGSADTETPTASATHMLDISTVIKASQAISGEIVLENLLENIMKIGIENAGAQRGFLIFERDEKLFVEVASDIEGKIEFLRDVPLDAYPGLPAGVINYVFKTDENLVLDNAVADERFARDPYIEKHQNKSILCVPIQQKNTMRTFLYLENNLTTNAFTRDRLELLNVLASQAAISIENARLFEIARRDGLTELINRRYFQYSLENEIEKARRNKHKLFLFMMDIDHFKYFNDTYGHPVGDIVLKNVARILRDNAYNKDLASRYGGEEFTLLLPRADAVDSRILAEKIRRDVENWHLHHNGEDLKVTLSLGMSSFPNDALDSETLINFADKALYQSKENGRNRLTVYNGAAAGNEIKEN